MLGSRAGYVGVPRNKRMPEDLVALRGGSSIDKQRGLWSRGIIKGFVILLALLGLLVVGRLALSANSASKVMGTEEETLRQSLFIQDDLKSGHLSADRLKGLIGVYYAQKPPGLDEMKTLLQKKEKVSISCCFCWSVKL